VNRALQRVSSAARTNSVVKICPTQPRHCSIPPACFSRDMHMQRKSAILLGGTLPTAREGYLIGNRTRLLKGNSNGSSREVAPSLSQFAAQLSKRFQYSWMKFHSIPCVNETSRKPERNSH